MVRRLIKIIDLGFIITIYGIGGLFCAKGLDNLYGNFDIEKEKKKSKIRVIFEMIGMLWLAGIVIYLFRNLMRIIPSPFHKLYGFDHNKVKELESMFIFTYVLFYFQKSLKAKMEYVYNL